MKALLLYGGWEGHEPQKVAKIFQRELKKKKVQVAMSDSLDALHNLSDLRKLDVILMHWTMGQMTPKQWQNLDKAVKGGVGFAGVHGGAGDSFRGNLNYQWMLGGQFLAHPHVGEYEVRLTEMNNPITNEMPTSFSYCSEQYYQLVDPGVNVLAKTTYDHDGHKIDMPCIWTKTWGKGRVFYSALGHVAKEFSEYPFVRRMTIKGFLWAAAGKTDRTKRKTT
jgi:hypothetical protein